jgi:hypothetical protein
LESWASYLEKKNKVNPYEIFLDSREYKIILNPKSFKNPEKGRNKLIEVINKNVNALEGIL